MSFGPNTKPARRVLGRREAAPSLSASSTARAVSIMAQTLTPAGAPTSPSRAPILLSSSTVEIFGTRMPSGTTAPAMATSSLHQDVSRLLVRTNTSRLPNPLASTAFATCSRAFALASGATESSRSRIRQSAARLRALSSARAFDPGMNSRLRRGRIMDSSLPNHEPSAITFQLNGRKSCPGHWHVVRQHYDLVPESVARRLSELFYRAAPDRTEPLPRI